MVVVVGVRFGVVVVVVPSLNPNATEAHHPKAVGSRA